jgi:hypothetical protein
MNQENNISFLLEDNELLSDEDNNLLIAEMMHEFSLDIEGEGEEVKENEREGSESEYFLKKDIYFGNEELYYDEEYTVKELMKICQYYDISKNIKASKCKKPDIISTIVYFESLEENYDTVQQRHKMWSHMTDLMADPKMRFYLLWS